VIQYVQADAELDQRVDQVDDPDRITDPDELATLPVLDLENPEQSAAFRAALAEAENVPLTPQQQAAHDAYQALDNLRDRLAAQKDRELADYAKALTQALTRRLADLKLLVPIDIQILPDYNSDAPNTPIHDGYEDLTNPINAAIADAAMLTPTPDALPGTPLQRLESTGDDSQ
jgi:hypothetical protein